ncbi:hypothetical protein [Dysgonomonas termitidis]|uniref:Uncharacterized protein n=1 Tax=Dysgonomonas termitidis TaxID=1516126 RepID=A0ABV9KTZ9_9BACT
MNIVRFPLEGLSADYGDIILDSVSGNVDVIVVIFGREVLHETYSPDTEGKVYIRDIGALAMSYDPVQDIVLEEGQDGTFIRVDFLIRELPDPDPTIICSVFIYRCDAETGGTLDTHLLTDMPLSRVIEKQVQPRGWEFVSFYGPGEIIVQALYIGEDDDVQQQITIGTVPTNDGTYYRYDVSPGVIASRCGITVDRLISYEVGKQGSETIRFIVNNLPVKNETAFIFRNTFGAQETFTCTGDATTEEKWTRDFGNIGRKQRQISRDVERGITVNTGHIDRGTVALLEDLLNAQQIRLLEDGILREVTIMQETVKVTSRKDDMASIEFKYRYASNNQLQARIEGGRIFDHTFDDSFN